MSVYNKITNSVADAVSKIMNEKLHPNQQKLDVHEPEKDKLTAKDFEMLRNKKKMKENLEDFSLEEIEAFMMSEDFEQLDELSKQTLKSYRVKSIGRDIDFEKKGYKAANQDGGAGSDRADQLFNKSDLVTAARKRAQEKMRKENVEQIDEYTSVGGKYVHRQKEVKDAEAGVTDWDKEEKMAKDTVKPAAKKRAYGAHQKRRTNTKLYKEMIESLKTGGLKALSKTIAEGKIQLDEEDNLGDIAKKHGMQFTRTTYGAGMKHPKHGEISINRYGEWHHTGTKSQGDSTNRFASLDKHLSSLKEEASQEEFTKELADQKAKFDGKKKTADVAKGSVQAVQNEATHTEIQMIDLTDASQKPQISTVDLEEKHLTSAETDKKEKIVKSMKKGLAGFKERYGDRAKSVMYATATKRAMGEEVEQIKEASDAHQAGYNYTHETIEDAQSKAEIHRHHKAIQADNPHLKGSQEHKDWTAGTDKAKADHLKDWS